MLGFFPTSLENENEKRNADCCFCCAVQNIEANAAPNVNKILLGNKSDTSKRAVGRSEGEALAAEFGVDFFETSAKTGSFVEDAFVTISRHVKTRLEREKPSASVSDAPVGVIKASKEKKQKKKCC